MAAPALTSYSAATGQPINGGRWAGGRLTGDVALSAVAPAGTLGLAASDMSGDVALSVVAPAGTLAGSVPVPFEIAADGIWTWFNQEVAVRSGDALYVGFLTSTGRPGVAKRDLSAGSSTQWTRSSTLETDDHNNPGVALLDDGRIALAYSMHSDYSGIRWVVSTNPGDVSAFGSELTHLATASYHSYNNVFHLSATGKFYNIFRNGGAPREMVSTSDWATWDAAREFVTSGVTKSLNCYNKMWSDGVDTIHCVFVDRPPYNGNDVNPTGGNVYHGYMRIVAGEEKFYSSNGTLLGGPGSLRYNTGTLVVACDTGAGPWWVWDITVGSDGHPRVLLVGFDDVGAHAYVHSRWTGSAWTTPTTITNGGGGLYTGNDFYSGGLCFDSNDATRVYLSLETSADSVWEVQEWRTSDDGATWSKYRDITSASAAGTRNCRPMSPRNADSRCACVFWSGDYDGPSFNTYNTRVMGVAAY